jgi:hypothetical protein
MRSGRWSTLPEKQVLMCWGQLYQFRWAHQHKDSWHFLRSVLLAVSDIRSSTLSNYRLEETVMVKNSAIAEINWQNLRLSGSRPRLAAASRIENDKMIIGVVVDKSCTAVRVWIQKRAEFKQSNLSLNVGGQGSLYSWEVRWLVQIRMQQRTKSQLGYSALLRILLPKV